MQCILIEDVKIEIKILKIAKLQSSVYRGGSRNEK